MSSFQLDKTDLKILSELQVDASLSNIELAQRVNLSPSPCLRRVNLLKEQGFFRGQVTLLDPAKLGVNVDVFIQISLSHQARRELQAFENTVTDWPEVMACYLMGGEFDYLLHLKVASLDAYRQFLERRLTPMEGIDNLRSSFSLKQVCSKTALPLDQLL